MAPESKKILYNKVCLNAFIKGLREPLKTILRLKDPKSIEQAYEQCKVEQSVSYNKRPYYNSQNNTQQPRPQNTNNNTNYRGSQNNRNYSSSTRTITNLETQTPTIDNKTIETTTTVTITENKNPFKTENTPTYGLHNIDLDNQNTAEQNFPVPAANQPDT